MDAYIIGDDFKEDGADHKTYGITQTNPQHENIIEVYKDKALRDRILEYLNKETP